MSVTIRRSVLGLALAASLLLAPSALAKPVDTLHRPDAPSSILPGTVGANQDLRGEHARDAARAITQAPPKQDLRGERARDASRPPVAAAAPPAASASKALPSADGGGTPATWLLVALGLAGTAIVAAGTSGLVRARRTA